MPPPEYGSQAYWDERYVGEAAFEWYVVDGEALAFQVQRVLEHIDDEDHIRPPSILLRNGAQIKLQRDEFDSAHLLLEAGCGASSLTADLVRLGAIPVQWRCVAFDYSATCVAARRAEPSVSGLTYERWDATKLPLGDGGASVILDKACVDAVDCASDGGGAARAVAREYARVLRVGGALLLVTCRDAARRLEIFRGLPLDVEACERLPKPATEAGRPGGAVFLLLRKYADIGGLRSCERADRPAEPADVALSPPPPARVAMDDVDDALLGLNPFLDSDDSDDEGWKDGLFDDDDTAAGYGGDAPPDDKAAGYGGDAPPDDAESPPEKPQGPVDDEPPPPRRAARARRGAGLAAVAGLTAVAVAAAVAARRMRGRAS